MSSARVVAVVRHRAAVLGCRNDAGTRSLPWASVGDDRPEAALASLLDSLGVGASVVERRGEPVSTPAGRATPFLVTVDERTDVGGPCRDPTWVVPGELRRGAESWWPVYRAVAPTVGTVAADAERGSAAIATDALWALRDAATTAATDADARSGVASTASALLDARPSMAALANRVNRAMAGADTPEAVERAATDGIERAAEDAGVAARLAAETLDGGRVLTLSRSGTVRAALLAARPSVVVLASRPGGEGTAVAEALADAGLDAEAVADAAVYHRLRSGDVDAVLVGADAVTPDGGVVNKVGTWAAAHAADGADVPCYAVCATDKIRPVGWTDDPPVEWRFDRTPPGRLTAVLTERGALTAADAASIAAEHAELAAWWA